MPVVSAASAALPPVRRHSPLIPSPIPSVAPISIPTYKRSDSIAGSVGSLASMRSIGSFKSIDSRGPRKGRRGWNEPTPSSYQLKRIDSLPPPSTFNSTKFLQGQLDAFSWNEPQQEQPDPSPRNWYEHIADPLAPEMEDDLNPSSIMKAMPGRDLVDNEIKQIPRYFCTFPGCTKRFLNRFGWERHEEAVHSNPTHWICYFKQSASFVLEDCLMCAESNVTLEHVKEHFSACAARALSERTFFRKDQLVQHIRRHVSLSIKWPPIPNALLQIWKKDNPDLDRSSLHCGFCGMTFMTWKDRTDHVSAHLSEGVCKAAWWPQRLPLSLGREQSS